MKEDILEVFKNILAHKESGISLEAAIGYAIADLEEELEQEQQTLDQLDNEWYEGKA